MKLDTGGPARPTNARGIKDGMTWLDACAMQAMAALITKFGSIHVFGSQTAEKNLCAAAYEYSKLMLAEKRRLEGGSE